MHVRNMEIPFQCRMYSSTYDDHHALHSIADDKDQDRHKEQGTGGTRYHQPGRNLKPSSHTFFILNKHYYGVLLRRVSNDIPVLGVHLEYKADMHVVPGGTFQHHSTHQPAETSI